MRESLTFIRCTPRGHLRFIPGSCVPCPSIKSVLQSQTTFAIPSFIKRGLIMDSRSPKRIKLNPEAEHARPDDINPASIRAKRAGFLSSISRSISPPTTPRSATPAPQSTSEGASAPSPSLEVEPRSLQNRSTPTPKTESLTTNNRPTRSEFKAAAPVKCIASPFKLTTVRDLPTQNVDTVSLHNILGNPLIKEAWIFNYCFDVDWLMDFFDSDIRNQVKVKIIHGSWRNEDRNKLGIDDACKRRENVEANTAFLPDQFGTHHSKMFVLFTHDDSAQVIIHTANMLAQDWTNLTQAAWMSPILPLLTTKVETVLGKMGSGSRFKHDFMIYLTAYGSKTKNLREQLARFDFTSIRGALVASAPSHMKDYPSAKDYNALGEQKLFGYPSLCRALAATYWQRQKSSLPHVICQVSSIATLPARWLNQFFPVLCGRPFLTQTEQQWHTSGVSIIYPTATNVATSLSGYASGGSIHMKAQSAAHIRQVDTLRPSLCQWIRGPYHGARAGRHEAAPHIKTFVSLFAKPTEEQPVPDVRWALLTSANLSQQAWGTLRESGKGKEKQKEVVVQSYEIGVLVWPELFAEDFDTGEGGEADKDPEKDEKPPEQHELVRMIPVFGKDMPSPSDVHFSSGQSLAIQTLVGLRLPYDLPLTPYGSGEMPWSMHQTHEQPDCHGRRWPQDFS